MKLMFLLIFDGLFIIFQVVWSSFTLTIFNIIAKTEERDIRIKDNYCLRPMKIKAIITIALIISAALLAGKVSSGIDTEQFREGKYIHLDNMEIAFNKANADISIDYRLNPFAQVYIFLFGSKNLEPKVKEIFSDFDDIEIKNIGLTSASIEVKNVSKINKEVYLFDSYKLGVQSDVLTFVYPEGKRRSYEHVNVTQPVFYEYDLRT
jgi:hypothetical protein